MNGKGYYIYEKGGKPKPDPSVQNVIEEYRKHAKAMPGGKVFPFFTEPVQCIY
jgi:enoyl-CoA hydratase/3-hydroxyacyl-CoA dehydrogenase